MDVPDKAAVTSLDRHPLLEGASDDTRRLLAAAATARTFRAERTLCRPGTPVTDVIFLMKGTVKAWVHSGTGEALRVDLLTGPSLWGHAEVIHQRPWQSGLATLEPSEIVLVPADTFGRALQKDSQLAARLAADLGQRLLAAIEQQRSMAFDPLEVRVGRLLLEYGRLRGSTEGDRIRLDLPLTQESLASDLGVSRRSITRVLDRLREKGMIGKKETRYFLDAVSVLWSRLGLAP